SFRGRCRPGRSHRIVIPQLRSILEPGTAASGTRLPRVLRRRRYPRGGLDAVGAFQAGGGLQRGILEAYAPWQRRLRRKPRTRLVCSPRLRRAPGGDSLAGHRHAHEAALHRGLPGADRRDDVPHRLAPAVLGSAGVRRSRRASGVAVRGCLVGGVPASAIGGECDGRGGVVTGGRRLTGHRVGGNVSNGRYRNLTVGSAVVTREPRRTGRVLPVRPAVEGSLGGYAARAAVVPEFDRRPDGPAIRRGTVSVAARSDSGYGCCQFRGVLLRAAPRLQSAERSRSQQRAIHLREPSRKPDGCGTAQTRKVAHAPAGRWGLLREFGYDHPRRV